MEAVGEWPFQRRHFAPVEGTATPRSCQTLPLKVISNLWQLLEKRRQIPPLLASDFVSLTSRKLVFDMSRDVGIPLFLVRATAVRKTRLASLVFFLFFFDTCTPFVTADTKKHRNVSKMFDKEDINYNHK